MAAISSVTMADPHEQSLLVPPLNFAMVAQGIYRSGYPNRKNFNFLKKLKLKSILFLGEEEYSEENIRFMNENDIQFFHLRLEGNQEPFVDLDSEIMERALQHVLDQHNHPILINCTKGRHRTGCLVGCLRKIQNWSLTSIFEEYRRFAANKVRLLDQQFIEFFSPQMDINLIAAHSLV